MIKNIAITVVGLSLVSGCATKKQLRVGLEEQAAAQSAELEAERAERLEAQRRMEGDITGLRTDLQGIRTEFGARIDSLSAGMKFAFPIHFGFDAATVRPEDHPALDRFAEVVQRHYPQSLITVGGFADPAGSASYNRRLSQRRAEAVREHLVSQGLASAQVRAVGYGEANPVVPGAAGTRAGAEMNRRVVFIVESRTAPTAAGMSEMPR